MTAAGLHERGILDTNVLRLLSRMAEPSLLPREPLITAITLAELSVGPLVAESDDERARRQAYLQQAEADFDPLPFDAAAARVFGRVAAAFRRSGRKPAARSYDAMIAAIAMSNGLALFTTNPDDFSGIDGLTVVPVSIRPSGGPPGFGEPRAAGRGRAREAAPSRRSAGTQSKRRRS